MAAKYYSDVKPNRDDKNSDKEQIGSKTAKTKPTGNPSQSSFKAPSSRNEPRLKERGGKDLPCPEFKSQDNRANEATGDLPPGI
jgi:hypothetical protein